MKKLFLTVLCAATALTCCLGFAACGEEETAPPSGPSQQTQPVLQNITGVTFENRTVTYDGSEHEITVTGTLPQGVTVSYTNNKGTNANTYNATATLSGTGYNPLTLNATLTIEKADVPDTITLTDSEEKSDGLPHSLTVSGTLPEGVTVSYTYNGVAADSVTAKGTYAVVATLSGANYKTKTLNATLTLKLDLSAFAKTVLDSILQRPEPWSFIPEALRPEQIAYTTAPVSDFTSFVNVANIGKKPIGRQFNVLYEGLTDTAKMLEYFDSVYAVGTTIAKAYQTFINQNPENYRVFNYDPGEEGGFHGRITLTDDVYELLIGNSTVSLELSYRGDTGLCVGRIQATDGMALKYESTENELTLAVKTTVSGGGNLKKIHFVRENNNMNGYYYEFTGKTGENETGVKTSAAIFSNETKLVVVSNKKELEDLKTNACEEVYNAVTGEYIGSEVDETVSKINYDTLWFMLPNVNGLTNIKVDPEANGTNPDTIYINDKTEAIKTKLVGDFSGKTGSRRFDIEMRDVWYVVKVQDGEKVKYETQKISIPMLFVQKEQTGTFSADFNEKNSVTATLKQTDIANITVDYEATKTKFLQFAGQSSAEEVETYIGNKNPYFNS